MALSSGTLITRRGAPRGNDYGYPAAPGVKIWRGGHLGLNAAGQVQPIQTAGSVSYAGIADRDYDNSASSVAGDNVIALRGCYKLVVPSAVFASINEPVYAVDDGTLTLTQNGSAPYLLQAGVLNGIDNGATFVLIQGS
jgi:hypothetical protein